MDNEQNTGQAQTIIVKSTKNVALATGLAFFFGPIGMCYATIKRQKSTTKDFSQKPSNIFFIRLLRQYAIMNTV